MEKGGVSTFKVAATYIGTVVGAGFATGQEILQFFANFGIKGLAGLVLTSLLFAVFGYLVIDLGRILSARSHQEIIRYSAGPFLGRLIDWLTVFFLFGAFTTMLAGSGALTAQQFGWPPLAGCFIMGALAAATVLRGIHTVINSISYVVPFLILSVAGTSLAALCQARPDFSVIPPAARQNALFDHWLLSALLYVSYNLILSIAVLGPLGAHAAGRRAVKAGAIWGGLGLGAAAFMICLAIAAYYQQAALLEVPMMQIAGMISPLLQYWFALVLIAEVYTTAVSALYGFATRFVDLEKPGRTGKLLVLAMTLLALLASQFGFSNLVKVLYPLIGYAGLILLSGLILTRLRRKAWGRQK